MTLIFLSWQETRENKSPQQVYPNNHSSICCKFGRSICGEVIRHTSNVHRARGTTAGSIISVRCTRARTSELQELGGENSVERQGSIAATDDQLVLKFV